MATNVTLFAPSGTTQVQSGSNVYVVAADGTISVPFALVADLLKAGCRYAAGFSAMSFLLLPPANDLVSIVAATIPVSGTPYAIAAQPAYPCKLNVRIVQTGVVAGLVLNLVGTDGRGNAITESVNVAGAATQTILTANAYSHVTSATPVGTVTNVTTIGVGQSNALSLPQLPPAFADLVVYKEGRMTGAAGALATPVDEAVGTVDTVAGTVIPSGTAPNGTTLSFAFSYTWNAVA